MGLYLNPSNENFRQELASEFYVDKTGLLSELNRVIDTRDKFVAVSRPRRFGKTVAASMIAAYYSKGCDSRQMFEPFKIAEDESFETYLNKYNVVKLDLNGLFAQFGENVFQKIFDTLQYEFKLEYPNFDFTSCTTVPELILNVYRKSGETFIVILDEYDVLVRNQVSSQLFASYLNFLISLFKNAEISSAISLAYLTGILPIVRDRIQSKLNNFTEYTMVSPKRLAEYIGFTSDEVKDLCERFNVSYDECRRWYDGYKIGKYEVYNPKAIYSAIINNSFESYWGITGSYEAVSDYIAMNFAGTKDDVIKMINGECGSVNVTTYMNTMTDFKSKDDVFTYLIHLGYLAYDAEWEECYIPNKEVQGEWMNALTRCDEYEVTNKIIADSRGLLKSTIAGDEEAVAAALDRSHIHVTSNRNYNNEDCLQSAIYLAYIYAMHDYYIIKECPTRMSGYSQAPFCENKMVDFQKTGMFFGNGFADIVFIPEDASLPALIVELKRNKDADTALTQIREKKYFASLERYSGNLLFVGVNYDTETKVHTCKIEKFVK